MTGSFDRCRVCGGPVPASQAEHARRLCEQLACSVACIKRGLVVRFACCEAAEQIPCVCTIAFRCATHGERHIGTHD